MDKDRLHPVLRQMPADWPIMRVDDLFAIQQGKQVSAKHRDGDRQRPFLRTKNVYWGRLDLAELDAMHFSEEEERRLRLLPGDLLTCEGGWVGRTAIWNGEAADCLYQNHLHRLRRTSQDTDPQFALYWMWYAFEIGEVYFGRQNVTTIPNLSKSRLGELPMPSPSSDEQRQIAVVLSAVQRAIERQERLIALTAELKKALMHKLFTEGTRGEPLKQTEIGPMPESWELVLLDHLATIERGKFAYRPRNAPEFYGGNIPFVQTGDVSRCDGRIRRYTQTLNERGLTISRMFPRGTILITIAANIGYAGILEFDSACTDSLVAVTPTRGDSAEFLNYYLQTQRSVMDRLAPQGTQKNINIQFLKPWPIPRPSTDEQIIIADALNKVDVKRRTHERMRDSLTSLFRTLLDQFMTVQIRVSDLDLSALEEAEREPTRAGDGRQTGRAQDHSGPHPRVRSGDRLGLRVPGRGGRSRNGVA